MEYRFLHPDARGEVDSPRGPRRRARRRTDARSVTYGVLRDITERKRAEEELRDLSRRLIRAHEEERALLARELHDDVTQRLAVLAIDARPRRVAAPDGAQAEAMQAVREGLVRLSEDVHSLAYQLHPSVLEELGLVEALRTECERLGRRGTRRDLGGARSAARRRREGRGALPVPRGAGGAEQRDPPRRRARRESSALRQMDGGLLLAVRDDGVGFDPAEQEARAEHLGLASMRERVRLVNGTLDIESAPGQGTTIVAWVPGEGGPR